MSAFEFPVLNGISPSWADIAVRISPLGGSLVEMGDISAINTSWTVEEGQQREGGRVIKRTGGSVSFEASMTLYASGYQRLLDALISQAPLRNGQRRLSLAFFGINIQWTPFGSTRILERRIKGCRLLGSSNDSSEGTDAAAFELSLSPIEICDVVNGVEVIPL